LGRTAEASVSLDAHVAFGSDGGNLVGDGALRLGFDLGSPGPQVHAQDREVGNHVARPAALDARWVYGEAVTFQRLEPKRELGCGRQRIAPLLGIAAGVG